MPQSSGKTQFSFNLTFIWFHLCTYLRCSSRLGANAGAFTEAPWKNRICISPRIAECLKDPSVSVMLLLQIKIKSLLEIWGTYSINPAYMLFKLWETLQLQFIVVSRLATIPVAFWVSKHLHFNMWTPENISPQSLTLFFLSLGRS